jgi:hypothetical protein
MSKSLPIRAPVLRLAVEVILPPRLGLEVSTGGPLLSDP